MSTPWERRLALENDMRIIQEVADHLVQQSPAETTSA